MAAITGDPLPDFVAAGHDRSVIAIKPEHLDAWLDPQAGELMDMVAILNDPLQLDYRFMVDRGRSTDDV